MEDVVREVVKSFLYNYRLVGHQLHSYNKFALKDLQFIIKEQSPIVITCAGNRNRTHVIEFGDVIIKKPMIHEDNGFVYDVTPQIARNRSLSYSAPVLVNIRHTVYNSDNKATATLYKTHDYVETPLFHLPVMVGSKLCHTYNKSTSSMQTDEDIYDEGGFFITNGNEKAVLAQEAICNNYPFVFVKPSGSSRYSHHCEIRSLHEDKTRSTSTLTLHITAKKGGTPPAIVVNIPFIDMNIPLPAVFKMLNVNSQEEMMYFILGKCTERYDSILHLAASVLDSQEINLGLEGDELLEHIGKTGTKETSPDNRVGYIRHLINNELLPHMGLQGTPSVLLGKAYYLGMAVRKLLLVYNDEIPPDDRDDYADKRLSTTGVLLALLFRQRFRKFISSIQNSLKKTVENRKTVNIVDTFKANRITNSLNLALSTGNWGSKKNNKNQTGVAQMMLRMSKLATVSHLRRINSQLNRDGKLPQPRQLHRSHFGILCMSETPEGANCGLIKMIALGMVIRIGHSLVYLKDMLQSKSVPTASGEFIGVATIQEATQNMHINQSLVTINGVICGWSAEPQKLVTALRCLRRSNNLPWDTTILYDSFMDQVVIFTDPGACLRPLFILENMHKFPQVYADFKAMYPHDTAMLWRMLLQAGVVEFVDKKEEMTLTVAPTLHHADDRLGHTHAQIHHMLLFGLCTALIPFPDMNQSPRNMYQTSMVKQAIGWYCLNFQKRMDSVSYVLHYPQKPLVSTMIEDMIPAMKDLPIGCNLVVAILCYSGYNVEDSVIMNKAAVDRGLLRCTLYRTYKESARGQGNKINKFEKPDATCLGRQDANYDLLEEDGLLAPGVRIQHGDVLIGSTTEQTTLGSNSRGTRNNNNGATPKRDHSQTYKEVDPAVVDAVLVSNTNEGGRYAMTRVRQVRIPEIGDKFSSRHGQKGVIGRLMKEEDMPFTADGIRPDLIINPHAFPSRMTIGQLMEQLLGKECAIVGKLGDGTPFQDVAVQDVHNRLQQLGMDGFGDEVMYNGETGQMMKNKVFIGMVYYQRLKHMVGNKIHGRATGPVQIMTRQPVEGRSNDGGLRFGEMERDTMIDHGAAATLQERTMWQSDAYTTVYCERCGILAEAAPPKTFKQGLTVHSKPYCRYCHRHDTVHAVDLPYAQKLFIQELGGLGIATRLSNKKL